jgi:hypothetical protein
MSDPPESYPTIGMTVSECGRPVTHRCLLPTVDLMQSQVSLTKRRAVDLCRVAACLCRMP